MEDNTHQQLHNQCSIISNLQSIAYNYGIKKFVKVESGDKYCLANGEDAYINRSIIAGDDEIYIGIYKNKEFMIASFFHELGHIVETKNQQFNSETTAWLIGFRLAKQYGYIFNEETYLWAIEQLSTYDNDEMRWKL